MSTPGTACQPRPPANAVGHRARRLPLSGLMCLALLATVLGPEAAAGAIRPVPAAGPAASAGAVAATGQPARVSPYARASRQHAQAAASAPAQAPAVPMRHTHQAIGQVQQH